MSAVKKPKHYYLLVAPDGKKFIYSNKGLQTTPHYISPVTAKYRANDMCRWLNTVFRELANLENDPHKAYTISWLLYRMDLALTRFIAFKLNANFEMVRDENIPVLSLSEFMRDVVGNAEKADQVKLFISLMAKENFTRDNVKDA